MTPLGVIADDVTGATDIASALTQGGMSVIQVNGIDGARAAHELPVDVDAVVIGLKIRTVAVQQAVAQSMSAWSALERIGAERCYWKYCSTFDSTPAGNIGPVADALRARLDVDHAVISPAYVANGRQVFHGHLFVDGVPLDESPMRGHPLTPMADSDLRRLLVPQIGSGAVAVHRIDTVSSGSQVLGAALERARADGNAYSIVDAVMAGDLEVLADAVTEHRLVTGSAGLAGPLVAAYRRVGLLGRSSPAAELPSIAGPTLVLAGSASPATRRQLARLAATGTEPIRLDTRDLAAHGCGEATAEMLRQLRTCAIVVVASNSDDRSLADAQRTLGREVAAHIIESTIASLASEARSAGVRRFVVAGGETSGAVTNALGATMLHIGPSIDRGVPWTVSLADEPLAIACKSGNFGSDNFFLDACALADRTFS